jgi:hypothetical protein
MRRINLTNNFHNTEVTLFVKNDKLSESQMKRARRMLCVPGCTCSGEFGHRGPQDGFGIKPIFDSHQGKVVGAWVHFEDPILKSERINP